MKRIKIWSLVLLSTLVLGLTSCLNSSSDSNNTYTGIVKVVSSYGSIYFQTQAGTLLAPTSASLATVQTANKFNATSGLAFIAYTQVTTQASSGSSSTTGQVTINLSYAVSLDGTISIVNAKGDSNDSIQKVTQSPLISLDQLSNSSEDKFTLYDSSNANLLIGANYYFSTPNHYFTLVFYPADVTSGATTMDVYLSHHTSDKSATYTSSYYVGSYPSLYYHSFNILNMVSLFTTKAGNAPTKIALHTNINETSTTLPASGTTYTINYSKTSNQ